MGTIKEINIKIWTYYFYNDIIDIETFDSNMLKLDKKSYKDLDIYSIGYVTTKEIGSGYDVNSLNPLYFRIDNASGYIEEIMKINTWFLMIQMKISNKNMMMFLMELWIKLKK